MVATPDVASCLSSGGLLSLNGTACVCPVGQYFSSGTCTFFEPLDPATGQPAPEISKFYFQPSEIASTVYLSSSSSGISLATFIILAVWLGLSLSLRFAPPRGIWFKLRRLLTRLDCAYSKKHWTDEQKVQVRRKTELGGALSVGSFIFIGGLVMEIIYQYVSYTPLTLQSVVPINGRDVADFFNNIDINVTTVSSMKCSQWEMDDILIIGVTEYDARIIPTTGIVTYSCFDTPVGPTVRILCAECLTSHDFYFQIWQFVDRPDLGLVAAAAGFEFSVRTTDKKKKVASMATGSVQAGSNGSYSVPATLRGDQSTFLTFRYVPRLFKDHSDAKLMQVNFHEFTPGTIITNNTELLASVSNSSSLNASTTGTANDTNITYNRTDAVRVVVQSQVLSAYLVETSTVPNIGFWNLVSKVGGIYKLGVLLFYLALSMSERFLTFLRYDEELLNRLAKRELARYHWRKLRMAVRLGVVTRSLLKDAEERIAEREKGAVQEQQQQQQSASLLSRMGTFSRGLSRVGLSFRAGAIEDDGRAEARGEGKEEHPSHAYGSSLWSSLALRAKLVLGTVKGGLFDRTVSLGVLQSERQKIRGQFKRKDPVAAPAALASGASPPPTAHVPLPHLASTTSSSSSSSTIWKRRLSSLDPRRSHSKPQLRNGSGDVDGSSTHFKFEDERHGSRSEHRGAVVRQFRPPSWIPCYEDLPAVPDLQAVAPKARDKKGKLKEQSDGTSQSTLAEAQKENERGNEGAVAKNLQILPILNEEGEQMKREEGGNAIGASQGTWMGQRKMEGWETQPGSSSAEAAVVCAADEAAGPLLASASVVGATTGNEAVTADTAGASGRELEREESSSSSSSDEEEGEVDPIDVYNYLIDMHTYQQRLRQDFLLAQSMLENIVQRFRPHSDL